MGPLQGDPAWSGGTQTAQFEILQNRVPYANFQKTKIPIDPPRFEPETSHILCGHVSVADLDEGNLAKKFIKI